MGVFADHPDNDDFLHHTPNLVKKSPLK